jgi:hypothetical protein
MDLHWGFSSLSIEKQFFNKTVDTRFILKAAAEQIARELSLKTGPESRAGKPLS